MPFKKVSKRISMRNLITAKRYLMLHDDANVLWYEGKELLEKVKVELRKRIDIELARIRMMQRPHKIRKSIRFW